MSPMSPRLARLVARWPAPVQTCQPPPPRRARPPVQVQREYFPYRGIIAAAVRERRADRRPGQCPETFVWTVACALMVVGAHRKQGRLRYAASLT